MESERRAENPEDKAEAVVSAADAFMNRLRPPAEEDVPLLTDVVDEAALPPPTYAPSTLSAEVQADLSRELEAWLDMHLTGAVLKVLDNLADQLVARISEQARADLLPRLQAVLSRDGEGLDKG